MLNEPELFELVKEKQITAETFDVPILRQIAAVLFETLDLGRTVEQAEILSRVESVDVAAVIMELAEQGQKKENFLLI